MRKPETLFPLPKNCHLLDDDTHRRVLNEASKAGLKALVVGGYLRDLVLSQIYPKMKFNSKDIDYVIQGGSALAFAEKMAADLNGHFVPLDKKNDTARVILADGAIFDFAGCVGKSIEEDILRRDFTINSLYLDPAKPDSIIDCVGGIDDIKSGIVKTLQETLLTDDPLRLLRAFRFAANLNFKIDPQTLKWITVNAKKISTVAGERISAELFTILALSTTEKIMPMLGQTGLLEAIFPELAATRKVTNNSHHHLNLFDHSLETAIQSEKEYCANKTWATTNINEEISFAVSRLAACKIACLLHDIGKPDTWVITDEGKHTFIGHEKLGAEMIGPIAERLRWSKATEHFITLLVRNHLRPGQLFHFGNPTKQAVNRLFRQSGDDFPALILLAYGDLGATQGPMMQGEKSVSLRENYAKLLAGFYEFSEMQKSLPKLLDGQDVMKLLNLQPGEQVGKVLKALQEAQETRKVNDRYQAEEFVRRLNK